MTQMAVAIAPQPPHAFDRGQKKMPGMKLSRLGGRVCALATGLVTTLALGTGAALAQSPELRSKSAQASSIERNVAAGGTVRIVVQYLAPVPDGAFGTGAGGLEKARAAVAGALDKMRSTYASGAAADRLNMVALDHVPMVAMTVTRKELEALAKDSRVIRIWENTLVPQNRVWRGSKSSAAPAPGAIASAASAKGMLVAVMSGGIDANHPAIKGTVQAEFCVSAADPKRKLASLCPNGKSIQGGQGSAAACSMTHDPDCLMGTALASVVAGQRSAGAVGVAADAGLVAIQVFSKVEDAAKCQGWGLKAPCVATELISQLKALDVLVKATTEGMKNLGAVTTTVSLGQFKAACEDLPYKPLVEALRKQGVAFVASSGDESQTEGTSLPGCLSAAVTVGAATPQNAVAPFTNMAGWVDLLAPGVELPVAIVGGQMTKANGTAFAAGHVAGAFAILRAQRPQASIDQIEAALKSTGVAIQDKRPAGKATAPGKHAAPLIRIDAALAALGGGAPPPGAGVAQPGPQPAQQPAPPQRPAVNCADPVAAGQSALTSGVGDQPACK